jgi:dihydroorotate dehydrogenase electron transfer subunit
MQPRQAELAESREILSGQWLQTYRAPWIATAAQPGQYVHVRVPSYPPPVLRRPLIINTFDRARGTISVHFRVSAAVTTLLAQMRPPDTLDMTGPLGRPFEVDPRTRHVLLIAGGDGICGIRALADQQIAANRQVTVAFGAPTAAMVYPSSLLPDEVEYVVATDDGSFGQRGSVTDLVPQFEAWADQAFASGPLDMLAALARLARGRQARLGVAALGPRRGRGVKGVQPGSRDARRRAWLQIALEQNIGCAVGTCLGCMIMGVEGPQRVCREGPVFASDEIAWEARWP